MEVWLCIFCRVFFVIEYAGGGDMMFHMQMYRRLPQEHARFHEWWYMNQSCLRMYLLLPDFIVLRSAVHCTTSMKKVR